VRAAGALIAVVVAFGCARDFRTQLRDSPRAPYGRVQSALVAALRNAGAHPGDRVFVPSPFGFHLADAFAVTAQPVPKYFRGRWSPAFRDGLRAVWGEETLSREAPQSLCYAMGLAYLRPQWVMAWNGDCSVMRPWWDFLRRFGGLPGLELKEASRTVLPGPYGGVVRVYRLSLSADVEALDRSVNSSQALCP
jgi:hypothetical protein